MGQKSEVLVINTLLLSLQLAGGNPICFVVEPIVSVGSCKLSGPPDDPHTEGVCLVDVADGRSVAVTWTTLQRIHVGSNPGTLAVQVECPKHIPDKSPT